MSKRDVLAKVDFGQRIAEEEGASLSAYFVETDNWRRLLQGRIRRRLRSKRFGKERPLFVASGKGNGVI